MTDREEQLLSALALMAAQYLEQEDQLHLDHMFMSAGERAVKLLAEYGLAIDDGRNSRWTDAGLTFLKKH